MGPDGPKWGQEDFFLLILTLPTFWAEWILILRICLIPNFQVSRFQHSWISKIPARGEDGWAGGRAGGLNLVPPHVSECIVHLMEVEQLSHFKISFSATLMFF